VRERRPLFFHGVHPVLRIIHMDDAGTPAARNNESAAMLVGVQHVE
jgi:hypothetical protein